MQDRRDDNLQNDPGTQDPTHLESPCRTDPIETPLLLARGKSVPG